MPGIPIVDLPLGYILFFKLYCFTLGLSVTSNSVLSSFLISSLILAAAKIRDEIRKLESTELEVTLNPKVKQYNLKNKIYPKGRSTMGMPGTRAQKGKKKWKQIK